MTGPVRDVRADAKHALTRALRYAGAPNPETLALDCLVALDGTRIGLTDTTRPANPDADPFNRPTPAAPDSDGLAAYRAARAAHAHKDQPQ